MATREELYALIDTLPEQTIERAHRMLSHLVNPPAPGVEDWRQRMAERKSELYNRLPRRPGAISGIVGGGRYDPKHGTGQSSFGYWDGDTYVTESLRNHKGHELTVVERLRIENQRLIYGHAVTGPGNRRDEREITFDLSTPG